MDIKRPSEFLDTRTASQKENSVYTKLYLAWAWTMHG